MYDYHDDSLPPIIPLQRKNKNQARKRLKTNVIPFKRSSSSACRLRAPPRPVHGQEIISAQLLAFPMGRRNYRLPMVGGDTSALPPLQGLPVIDLEIHGHISDRCPQIEQVIQSTHDRVIARDELSPQGAAILPTTTERPQRTIRPMGRNLTPVQFNKGLARRLKAARIAAGYDNLKEFAEMLGVHWERYKKWESGRTPIQHEFIPRACELTKKDANYFFQIELDEQLRLRTVG